MRYFRMYKWQTLNKNCIATLLSGLAIGFTIAYMLFTTDDPFADPHSSYEMHNMQGPEIDPDDSLPAIALDVREGRKYLWGKTKRAFQHIYKNYLDQADWFVKADDDTYMIVENLRYMLMKSSPNEPVYYGCKFKPFVKQGYMSGGAGYVLSREAVKKFIEVGLKNATGCAAKSDGGPEDVELGKCMEAANVRAGDTRDSLGRGRFFPFVPEHHLIPGHVSKSFWYWNYIYYDSKEGMECCSDNAVSFHYISPNQMYVLEYLIYHLRPYGISNHVEMPHSLVDSKDVGNKSSNIKISGKNNNTEIKQKTAV